MPLRVYRPSSGQRVILRCIGPAGLACIDALAATELLLPLQTDTPEATARAV